MSVFTKKKSYYENFAFFRCFVRLCSHKCIDISRNNGFSSFFLASFAAARHLSSRLLLLLLLALCYTYIIFSLSSFHTRSRRSLFISAVAVNFRSVRIRYISGDGVGVRALKIYLFRWLLLSVVDYIAQALSFFKTLYLFNDLIHFVPRIVH